MSVREDERDGLSREEAAAFDALPLEREPPAHLEERVLGTLRGRGLVAGVRRRSWWAEPAGLLAAAAVVLLMLAGSFVLGRNSVAVPGTEPGFLLALYEGPEFSPFSDANFAERYEDYNRWIAGLREGDHFVTGLPLDSTGVVLVPGAEQVQMEERHPGGEDGWVDGLFVIRAESYEEALEIARTAPHLSYRGRISVRRITPIL